MKNKDKEKAAAHISSSSPSSSSSRSKEIPKFINEDEEREFWAEHSILDFVENPVAIKAEFPNLKPTSKSISIRLPVSLLNHIKKIANKQDIPYQALIKLFLFEKVKEFQDKSKPVVYLKIKDSESKIALSGKEESDSEKQLDIESLEIPTILIKSTEGTLGGMREYIKFKTPKHNWASDISEKNKEEKEKKRVKNK